VSRQIR